MNERAPLNSRAPHELCAGGLTIFHENGQSNLSVQISPIDGAHHVKFTYQNLN